MLRLNLLIVIVLLCTSISIVNPATADEPKTNVLFILADDLGWRDLSNEGSTFYESPNIDRIANEGLKLIQGYATCQVCSPSRASIMTGKYPARLNITEWIGAAMGEDWKRKTKLLPAIYEHNLAHSETTLAEAFRRAIGETEDQNSRKGLANS
jgi:arylsulfatase A-like enzyme